MKVVFLQKFMNDPVISKVTVLRLVLKRTFGQVVHPVDTRVPHGCQWVGIWWPYFFGGCNGTTVPGLDLKVTKGDEGKLLRLVAEEPKGVTI